VDGQLNNDYAVNLMVEPGLIMIGTSGETNDAYNGYIANAQLFDSVIAPQGIIELMEATRPTKVAPPVGVNDTKVDESIKIYYSQEDSKLEINSNADNLIQQVQIVTMDGKVIHSVNVSNLKEYECSFAENGIYIVVVKGTRSSHSGKIIVQ
jgi:hypothetical protein